MMVTMLRLATLAALVSLAVAGAAHAETVPQATKAIRLCLTKQGVFVKAERAGDPKAREAAAYFTKKRGFLGEWISYTVNPPVMPIGDGVQPGPPIVVALYGTRVKAFHLRFYRCTKRYGVPKP
jgi:hypothetical protein